MSSPMSLRATSRWLDAQRVVLPAFGAVAIVAALWLATLRAPVPAPPPAQPATGGFQTNIDDYVALRGRQDGVAFAAGTTSDPGHIFSRERAFGHAVQWARLGVGQGNIFRGESVADVRRIIARDLAQRSPGDRAALAVDVTAIAPRVNELYPYASPLPTFPPLLLAALPVLPDGLEYRFMGDALIIRDVDANLIVDYLPGVLTR
jgi:hypothetical protein